MKEHSRPANRGFGASARPSKNLASPNPAGVEGRLKPVEKLESLAANSDTVLALEALPAIFDEVVPLNQRHRLELGRTIRLLWEDLTSEREHRTAEYLGSPAYYSSYVRYFLPWNILRLASILGEMPLSLKAGSVVTDIGSGPLSLPIALYVARPDLRGLPLTVYCADKTERILKVGQTIFESLCAKLSGSLPPWKIVLLRQPFGTRLPEKADLITAANVFNEFFWKSKAPLGARAALTAEQIIDNLNDEGSVFFMEPGDPRSGSFMSAMRAAFLAAGARPVSPCPHSRSCPMPGVFHGLESPLTESSPKEKSGRLGNVVMPKRRDKYPWCHFTVGTESAPGWLKKLSDEAGLPKEKLVFSYLLVALPGGATDPKTPDLARIVSEAFPLPDRKTGRYACSAEGYTLIRYDSDRFSFSSGDLVRLPAAIPPSNPPPRTPEPREKRGARSSKTHFADLLETRNPPLAKRSGPDRDIDEKSGAVIKSY